MSGPKDYNPPPPKYSANVFNGKLHEIFSLQSSIKSVMDEISGFSISDNERSIAFDCSGYIRKNSARIAELIKVFTLDISGTFGQTKYDQIDSEIAGKIRDLNTLLNEMNSQKQDFRNKEKDYNSFVQYEKYLGQTANALSSFRNQVLDYLATYLQADFTDLYIETKKAIEGVDLEIQQVGFEYGFRNLAGSNRKKVEGDVEERKAQINGYRAKVSDKVISSVREKGVASGFKSGSRNKSRDKDVQGLVEKIEEFIAGIDDFQRQEHYREKLTKLANGSLAGDRYYYKELFNDLLEAESVYVRKQDILKEILKLNQIQEPKSYKTEKNTLLQDCLALIERDRIKANEYDNIMGRIKNYKKKSEERLLEESIIKKESIFLKAQLVRTLRDMNYDAMDDMEVIDFEKESDFLFAIPGQKNYLNLRFRQDGSFMYNFLIPEKKQDLSIDQKQQKLTEMENVCQEFKGVLRELSGLGLKVNLDKEMRVSEKALIQTPEKCQARIKSTRAKKTKKQAEKKKLLQK